MNEQRNQRNGLIESKILRKVKKFKRKQSQICQKILISDKKHVSPINYFLLLQVQQSGSQVVMQQKFHESADDTVDQTDEMLKEIRNILTNTSHHARSNFYDRSDVQRYLSESFLLAQSTDTYLNKDKDLELMHSKISEASVLLGNQSPMIKSYVRQKIESNFFSRRVQEEEGNWRTQLLRKRDQLERKRLEERIQEEECKKRMIEAARQYQNNYPVGQIPLMEIESLVHKQGEDYDGLQQDHVAVKSIKRGALQFEGVNVQNLQNYEYNKKQSPKFKKTRSNKFLLDKSAASGLELEFIAEEEDETSFVKNSKQQNDQRIRKLLSLHPTFVNCLGHFLSDITKRSSVMESNLPFNVEPAQKKKYIYPNKTKPFPVEARSKKKMLSTLTSQYQTKPLALFASQTPLLGHFRDEKEIKRIISKRIGDTNKFHTKQCVLKGNTLYYTDEAESVGLNKMKKIEVTMQPVDLVTINKDEGNVFSKKEKEVTVVCLKGKERNLYYEYEMGEGVELTQDINHLKSRAFHIMSSMLAVRCNPNMQKFIFGGDQAPYNSPNTIYTLDLSHEYIRGPDQYSKASHRQTFLQLISSYFPRRTNTIKLMLSNSQLGLKELSSILQGSETHFHSLQDIDISNNKLDNFVLSLVFKLVSLLKIETGLKLNLSSCQLNDDIFLANAINLNKAGSKISQLNISDNQLTSKSISALTNCLASKVCSIRKLDMSFCPVSKMSQISKLIQSSHKLEFLSISSCNLDINNPVEIQKLVEACQCADVQLKGINMAGSDLMKSISIFPELTNDGLSIQVNVANARKVLQTKYHKVEMI